MHYLLFVALIVVVVGMPMDNLKVAYQWKMFSNFVYPSASARLTAVNNREFIPENNLPLGLEVYQDRLFITIPRWKHGVAASLVYINLTDAPMDSPPLYPYPNWESHQTQVGDTAPQIVSPFRIRADRCGRLWVLDTGYVDILEETFKELARSRLLIYDLRTDQLLRSYPIPDGQVHQNDSFFANIAVEDNDCQNSFAYLADIARPALVVYSYQAQKSWLVRHHYFNIDPLAGQMTVGGQTFQWTDGIFGLALSAPDSEGYSTLYFHPMTSFDEFAVSTKVLHDENFAGNQTANFHEFKRLGSRGHKGQSGASFLDKESNVLFFASVHLNAVVCWRTTNNYTKESHSRVFMSNETMVFPNDIKVDANSTLWVLSDKLPIFMYSTLDYNEYNFRILKGKVADAIKNTACDSKMVVNKTIVERIKGVFNKDKQRPSSSVKLHNYAVSVWVVTVAILLLR